MTRAERERLAVVKDRAIQVRMEWRNHRKLCRLCAQLSKNRSQYCTDGWEIRLQLHDAERILADLSRPPARQEQTLF